MLYNVINLKGWLVDRICSKQNPTSKSINLPKLLTMISKFAVVVRASEETFFALRTFVNWKYYVRGGYLRIINSDSIGTLFALDLLKIFTKISQPLNMVYPNDIILAYSLFVILDLSGD